MQGNSRAPLHGSAAPRGDRKLSRSRKFPCEGSLSRAGAAAGGGQQRATPQAAAFRHPERRRRKQPKSKDLAGRKSLRRRRSALVGMRAGLPTGCADSTGKRFQPAETLAAKGQWTGVPIGPAALVILSAGRAAVGRPVILSVGGASRRSRRTSLDAKACGDGGVSGLGGARRTVETQRRAEGTIAASPPARSRAGDSLKSGSQGSMGRCAHRPCCPWFVHRRVRLTKPPQIAGHASWGRARTCGSHGGCCRALACGDWCRFRAAGLGSGVHPTCGRTALRPAARAGVSSS